jgi:hypothetical protein
MKSLALPLLALVAFQAAAPQAGTVLRRTLKADATDTYEIVDHSDILAKTPAGDMPVKVSSTRTFVLKTKTVDDKLGTAAIEATTTVDKLEADGAASDLAKTKPAPVTQTGKIDVRGRITYEKKAGGDLSNLINGTSSTLAAGTFVEFPEKALKVGDSWDMVVPKDPMIFGEDQKLTATLTGEKDMDGVQVWVVSVRGVVKSAVDSSKIPGAKPVETPIGPMTIRINGQDTVSGEGLVEKSSGRTVSMTIRSASKKTIELVETGISMESTGTSESKITLKKPGA